METENKFSALIDQAILNQGRKKSWICEQLQITLPTLNSRLLNNDWSPAEKMALIMILDLKK